MLQSLWELERRTNSSWRALHDASDESARVIEALRRKLDQPFASEDYSIAVFGSLARREFTRNSDLDWTLLIDGAASDDHWNVACQVRAAVSEVVSREPGREGTFGSFAFSHDIVHQIGGADDTNRNTTRLILLLLESIPFGRSDAYDRVIRGVLGRYLGEDEAFLHWRSERPVPRFLLNDFARFWWTMAVDFAYKRRTRQGEGAVLRNLKLRMSRKLLYAAGMLACFSLALDPERLKELREAEQEDRGRIGRRVEYFRALLGKPPLEILASHLARLGHLSGTAGRIFTAYNRFLEALADPEQREHLEKLSEADRHSSALYRELRQATHEFREGLIELFFDGKSDLGMLTRIYGVF